MPGNIGSMKWSGEMPLRSSTEFHLRRSDDFDDNSLSPQWEWNYQPRQEMFSLTERKGWLRMKAYRPLRANDLMLSGNTLTQRTFRSFHNEVIIKMDVSGIVDGQKCGLCHFSKPYSFLGVKQEAGLKWIEYSHNGETLENSIPDTPHIWLKSEWGLDGKSLYAYSWDGENYISFGNPYQLSWGNYRGDRIGIFCFNNEEEKGYVDIDYFHYRIEK